MDKMGLVVGWCNLLETRERSDPAITCVSYVKIRILA